jgi:CelD/BcsL family acetyltransferase involved in cellulose biosynthesis
MTALQLERVDDLDALQDDLNRLAEASANVFGTYEFLSTWWRHFGADGTLELVACRDEEGSTLAVLPLYLWRSRPVRVLRFLGHGAGDELGPLSAPADRERAGDAQLAALRGPLGRWDVLVGEQLPGRDTWPGRAGARTLVREGSPLLGLDPELSWDGLMATWSSKLRRDLRGDERKLTRDHGLAFRLADDPERLDRDLDVLFELHESRWPDSPFGQRQAFHREFAAIALERGWLRLWFLELEGKPAAVWHGFRFGAADAHFQVGRDPSWHKFGTGTLLTGHTIREALADGQREYRFLRGGEDYKYRFATDDPGLQTIGLGRGLLGRAALTSVVAARRIRRRDAAAS